MGFLTRICPNPSCSYAQRNRKRFYQNRGTFLCKWSGQRIPRYRCCGCGKSFSTSTFKKTYRQKKPYLNQPVYEFYCSGTTQRRLAKVLRINRKTVAAKFRFLAKLATETHRAWLNENASTFSEVLFDEMESFEHTRLKPLTIPILVNGSDGKIIGAHVAQLGYKGRFAALAFKKYGPREDKSHEACVSVLNELNGNVNPQLIIRTDFKLSYPKLIEGVLPNAIHEPVKGERVLLAQRLFRNGRRNVNDPLFWFNLMAAKIRHDLSRMGRKVWVTTKNKKYLQSHLDLYIAYHNQYVLFG